jgi:hypothetical protein
MESDESTVDRLERGIKDRLLAMRPWWGAFAQRSFIGPLALLGLILANFLTLVPDYVARGPSESKTGLGEYLSLLAVCVGVGIFLGWTLTLTRDVLFPEGTFCIGQGTKRHSVREGLRSFIVGTVFLGSILAIGSGLLVTFIAG